MNKYIAFLAYSIIFSTPYAQGPNEGFIMQAEGARHLLLHSDPVYPPIAKAAHVQGSVLLHVSVDPSGKVTKVVAIGGPEMLRATAVNTVAHWTYEPFLENGKPGAVEVAVEVPFSLGIPAATEKSDNTIGQAFFPVEEACRNASAAQQWTDAVQKCGQAVVVAERFPDPATRRNEMRGAYQAYGVALMSSGDPAAALKEFNKALATANLSLTATDAEYASAYLSQAIDEHLLKMLAEAERDYGIAEDSYRKAIVSLPDMTKQYSFSLSLALAYHSIFEQQTGHAAESETLRGEALRLNPHAMDRFGGAK